MGIQTALYPTNSRLVHSMDCKCKPKAMDIGLYKTRGLVKTKPEAKRKKAKIKPN